MMPLLAILSMSEMVCFSALLAAVRSLPSIGGADAPERVAQPRADTAGCARGS